MTTKPKTRKAPTAKPATSKIAATVASSEPKREVRTIERLVAKWRWLEADAMYKAARVATDEKEEAALNIHNQERQEIESLLATLVPQTFYEACELLGFATQMIEEGGRWGLEISMLRNVKKALPTVWRNEMDVERQKAREEATIEARYSVESAFRVQDIIAKRKEKEAA
jgi:hypothetical protein